MNKNELEKLAKMGFVKYLIITGFIKLGLIGGFLVITIQYFYDKYCLVKQIGFQEWFSEYIIWIPLAILAGIILAVLIWLENFQK